MNFTTYRKFVINTINEFTPNYNKEEILKELINKKIVSNNAGLAKQYNALDISHIDEESKLGYCAESLSSVLKYYEQWEFIKSYKHSVIFRLVKSDFSKVEDLLKVGEIQKYDQAEAEHDTMTEINRKSYSTIPFVPTMVNLDKMLFLKFSVKLEALNPLSRELSQLKYPILVVIHKDLEVLEIRFDRVKSIFKANDLFYKENINYILDWLKLKIGITVGSIDMTTIIDDIIEDNNDEVAVHAQYMSLKMGGKAKLEVGHNAEFILPLLGELKRLIEDNIKVFDESPKIKQLLNDFVSEIELTSDLPWISLCWKNPTKSKQVIVKFSHNYLNEDYCLLQYFGSHTSMERMNYVTRYLVGNKSVVEAKI
ncbi:hypothetical protein [Brevibacillus choshinensis]|uniref:hypothetical protein n=1 Tax=Brevibacillus choshinensis TaxID=54911 RepID=UPI002E1D27DB|nr:hypothetical protein [Brevibacillus choshinensis]